jgi:hypothetical protein
MGCFQISQHHQCMLTAEIIDHVRIFIQYLHASDGLPYFQCLRHWRPPPMVKNRIQPNYRRRVLRHSFAQVRRRSCGAICSLAGLLATGFDTTYQTTFCEMPLPHTIAVMQSGATTVRSAALRESRPARPISGLGSRCNPERTPHVPSRLLPGGVKGLPMQRGLSPLQNGQALP